MFLNFAKIAFLLFSLSSYAAGKCPCEDEVKASFKNKDGPDKDFAIARCQMKAPVSSPCSKKEEAYKTIENLAKKGHGKSEYLLGWWYLMGREDQKPDEAKAFLYFERAAAKNIPPAQHELGQIYEHGMGRPVDLDKAIDWYTKAEKNGEPRASVSLLRAHRLMLENAAKKR